MKPEEVTKLIDVVENYSRDKIVEALRTLQNCLQTNKTLCEENQHIRLEAVAKKKEVEQLRKILHDRDVEISYLHGLKVKLENENRVLKQGKTSITIKVNEFREKTKQLEQQGNLISKLKQQCEDLEFEKKVVCEANSNLGTQICSLQRELNNRNATIDNLRAQVQIQHKQLFGDT